LTRLNFIGFIMVGVVYAVLSEWANVHMFKSWGYNQSMPIIPWVQMGLTPFLQWIVIPPIVILLVRHHLLSDQETTIGREELKWQDGSMFNSPMLKRQTQHFIHPDIKKTERTRSWRVGTGECLLWPCVDVLSYRIVWSTRAADLSLLLPTQYYDLFVRSIKITYEALQCLKWGLKIVWKKEYFLIFTGR
jgi:hypothetical protein